MRAKHEQQTMRSTGHRRPSLPTARTVDQPLAQPSPDGASHQASPTSPTPPPRRRRRRHSEAARGMAGSGASVTRKGRLGSVSSTSLAHVPASTPPALPPRVHTGAPPGCPDDLMRRPSASSVVSAQSLGEEGGLSLDGTFAAVYYGEDDWLFLQ